MNLFRRTHGINWIRFSLQVIYSDMYLNKQCLTATRHYMGLYRLVNHRCSLALIWEECSNKLALAKPVAYLCRVSYKYHCHTLHHLVSNGLTSNVAEMVSWYLRCRPLGITMRKKRQTAVELKTVSRSLNLNTHMGVRVYSNSRCYLNEFVYLYWRLAYVCLPVIHAIRRSK